VCRVDETGGYVKDLLSWQRLPAKEQCDEKA